MSQLKHFQCCFAGDWKWTDIHDLREVDAAARFVELHEREARIVEIGSGDRQARVAVRLNGERSDGRPYIVTGSHPEYSAARGESKMR
jgi:hypothetical protein